MHPLFTHAKLVAVYGEEQEDVKFSLYSHMQNLFRICQGGTKFELRARTWIILVEAY